MVYLTIFKYYMKFDLYLNTAFLISYSDDTCMSRSTFVDK